MFTTEQLLLAQSWERGAKDLMRELVAKFPSEDTIEIVYTVLTSISGPRCGNTPDFKSIYRVGRRLLARHPAITGESMSIGSPVLSGTLPPYGNHRK